jgi:4'-phosphopantetheinyl transferase
LRLTLGEFVGAAPETLRLEYGPRGKPRLAYQSADQTPSFSLAHSGELALVAVSATHDVGVDVERIRPIPEALEIAETVFDPRVCTALYKTLPQHRDAALLRQWTRLEALAKAAGCGLASLLEWADKPKGAERCSDEYGHPVEHFNVVDLPLPLGYVGSLAVAISHSGTAARHWNSTTTALSATAGW